MIHILASIQILIGSLNDALIYQHLRYSIITTLIVDLDDPLNQQISEFTFIITIFRLMVLLFQLLFFLIHQLQTSIPFQIVI